jgi:hypothetical protein
MESRILLCALAYWLNGHTARTAIDLPLIAAKIGLNYF